MFTIIDTTVLKEEEELKISASIDELLGNLCIDCEIPQHRTLNVKLHGGIKSNLVSKSLSNPDSNVQIALSPLNSDSFTLEFSDENGIAMSRYRIMRSFC